VARKVGDIMAREVTVWKPFREMVPFDFESMRREMDRLWDSFSGRTRKRLEEEEWLPVLDVSETKDEYVVKAEIPGIDAKDIDISLSDGMLTIRGEKKQEKEQKEENYHLVERSYGAFTRSIQLGGEVQADKIKAECKNGILKIVLPKSEKAKQKEVKIQVEGK
jgi:HSP20 family protein